jgi:hypothetical protein
MDLGTIKSAEIKVARTSSPKHKAGLALILHAIEQAKTVYILVGSVTLPLAPRSRSRFVELSIVPSHHQDLVPCANGLGVGMTTDTSCIGYVRLLQVV